jgi:sodium/hydrogen antiporter
MQAPMDASFARNMLAVLLGDISLALLMGVALGYGAGFVLRTAEARDWIEAPSILMMSTALALLTLALVQLAGSDGILAVFVAGLAFDQQVSAQERLQEERVVEGVDRLFTSPIFILLGMLAPWREWFDLGWPALALLLAFFFLRRMPLLLVMAGRIRALPTYADAAFAGWFGPLGVAALYYVASVHHQVELPELWPLVSFLVSGSIFIHGLSAMPLSHVYAAIRKRQERRPSSP